MFGPVPPTREGAGRLRGHEWWCVQWCGLCARSKERCVCCAGCWVLGARCCVLCAVSRTQDTAARTEGRARARKRRGCVCKGPYKDACGCASGRLGLIAIGCIGARERWVGRGEAYDFTLQIQHAYVVWAWIWASSDQRRIKRRCACSRPIGHNAQRTCGVGGE